MAGIAIASGKILIFIFKGFIGYTYINKHYKSSYYEKYIICFLYASVHL